MSTNKRFVMTKKKGARGTKAVKQEALTNNTVQMERSHYKPFVDCNALVAPVRLSVGRIFPDRMRVQMCFVEEFTISSTGSPVGLYTFYGNSAYDVDYTGTGGQPPWFDTLITIYNQFYVHKTKMLITCSPISGGTMLNIALFPTRNRTVTAITYDDAASFWKSSSGVLDDYASSAALDLHLSSEATTDEVYGQPLTMCDSAFRGGIAGPPTNTWFWNLYYAQSQGNSNTKFAVKVQCILDVTCSAEYNLGDY